MTSKEKYLKRIARQETDAIKEAKERNKNKFWVRQARILASKILIRLDELDMSKQYLADELGVSLNQVNSMVKGSYNFEFSMLVKLQEVLNVSILSWCNE